MGQALRSSIPASRLEALQSRKAAIEEQLLEEQRSFASSDTRITELKKMKLHIKQEMEGIRQTT
jgi:hypothetical protein